MPSVLIADDEENIRKVVRINLQAEGYDVYEAPDGAEAVELVKAHAPDVLILDVKMPRMDGLAVLRKLQSDGIEARRVVMLTGATEEEDHLRGWGAGADDYITKPFELEDLLGAIERVMNLSDQELQQHRERQIERARLLRQLDRFLE